jgi:hypothetical protein
MPTATSFTALGKGNGLASCAYRKTFNAATHSGLYTLQEIMQLYWNTSSIRVTATEISSDPRSVDRTLDFTAEPFERVCVSDAVIERMPFAPVTLLNGLTPTENQSYIGFDESTEKYFLNIPEIIFGGIDDEGFIRSGNNAFPPDPPFPDRGKPATDSSGIGKTWSIDGGALQGTASATIEFNFYTYS